MRKFKQEEDTYAVKVKELELERRVLANKFKEKESVAQFFEFFINFMNLFKGSQHCDSKTQRTQAHFQTNLIFIDSL